MEDKKIMNEISDDDLNAVTGGWGTIITKEGSYSEGDVVGLVQRRCKGCGASIITGTIIRTLDLGRMEFETECCGTYYLIKPEDIYCKY